jgi:hypothetical protein
VSVCQAAGSLQGRTALLLRLLVQACGVPGPRLARCMLEVCPDLSWAGWSRSFSALELDIMRKLELSAEEGTLDHPEVAALAGEAEFYILGQLSEPWPPLHPMT